MTQAGHFIQTAIWWLIRAVGVVLGLAFALWMLATHTLVAVAVALLWLLPIFVGVRVADRKGRDTPIGLAVLLGWIGIILALALPDDMKRCPACDEKVRRAATVCRYCGHDLA